ncbi:solute carrier family 66 member 2 isoform X5 [Arctopsyche grandis]|uniref:solute carrier family 66 member 2 isoform X5 n=1 Tax=Arctopsyche grandis TaxID=121162 RepID=UPI00406D9D38
MEWVLSDELGLRASLGAAVSWGAAVAMVAGGAAPYIPQYLHIRRNADPDGFSLYVCLALLLANTLRILFWFGKRYEMPLLIQSIIMNITMFIMIHLCVSVQKKNQIIQARERIFTDMERKYFWAWTDFQSYVDCMLVFSVIGATITYFLIGLPIFVETIGFLAVFTEAMIGAPQISKNHQNKSTEGMSLSMVIMWLCGDVFKTVYFLVRSAPPQFWFCGSLQILLDIVILFQVIVYIAII